MGRCAFLVGIFFVWFTGILCKVIMATTIPITVVRGATSALYNPAECLIVVEGVDTGILTLRVPAGALAACTAGTPLQLQLRPWRADRIEGFSFNGSELDVVASFSNNTAFVELSPAVVDAMRAGGDMQIIDYYR
eukprot:gnl/Hemi2/13914_TR4722_c0_g1_i1.p1 gnl/Hemi2/13914_TR4722_c0_g1~~gnl/Hemi2/13914_TR4722_c0_g1_i1.p1  ORF type:complete len:135 (-),score=26.75 gnl/Hemi2/13914_TR4722_c0_g1_i1:83-487(-)